MGMGGGIMARMHMKGLEEYEKALSKMANHTEEIAEAAVYVGAGIVADAMRAEVEALPVGEGQIVGLPPKAEKGQKISVVSRRQKGDLLNGLGIAQIENTRGYIQTKVGFDGYGSVKTKKYPNGLPNVVLARSINSGTSFFSKIPFARRAVNSSKTSAVKAMGEKVEEEIKKVMEG